MLNENLAKHFNERLALLSLLFIFIYFCLSLNKSVHLKRSFFCRGLEFKSIGWKNCIAACACLCKFSARLVLCWLFEFFSSLISIMSMGKEQTIDSQHLFIYFQLFWISLKFVIEKNTYICSLGVNFLKHSCWYHVKRAPNSFLQLFQSIVGNHNSRLAWNLISDMKP